MYYRTLLLLVLFLFALPALSAEASPPELRCLRVTEPPQLDGDLGDPVWQQAETIGDFVQRELQEGQPSTEVTEVRAIYTDKALFLGVFCGDAEPEQIVAEELARDFDITKDDDFEIAIDTYLNHRNGFFFAVNPNGARNDALFTDEGQNFNGDWNGLWDCRAARIANGWSAEIEIPFSTLRYAADSVQTWGINFERNIKRKREQSRWTAWERSYRLLHMSRAGLLTGLENLPRKNPVYLKPFALGGLEKNSGEDWNTKTKAGADLKYSITPALTLDITTNTDFAQVEVDEQQVNLTRFPLFFPEKRDFFLESAEFFDTQLGGIKPFYSRRIGLTDDGREIPILGGARLTGHAGKYQIGALTMQTDEKYGQPSTNYSVGRVRREIGKSSYLGAIATNKQSSASDYNRVLGLDAFQIINNVVGTDRLFLGAALAGAKEPLIRDRNLAYRVYANYPGETVTNVFSLRTVQRNFNPGIGYTGRDEFTNIYDEIHYYLRPKRWGIQYFDFMPLYYDMFLDGTGNMQSFYGEFRPFAFTTNSGEVFEVNLFRRAESLLSDFQIFDEVVIPQGEYWWTEYEAYFATNSSRRFSFWILANTNKAFAGEAQTYYFAPACRINKHLSAGLQVQQDEYELPGGRFVTRQWTGRVSVGVTPQLNSSLFAQYNNGGDEASANFRIHWIPKIGSDAYLVYTQVYDTEDKIHPTNSTVIAKLAWLFTI